VAERGHQEVLDAGRGVAVGVRGGDVDIREAAAEIGDAVHRSDIGQARRVVGDRTVEDFGDVIGVDAGRGQIDGGVVAQQGGDIVSAQGTAAEFDVSDGAVFQGIDEVAGGEVG